MRKNLFVTDVKKSFEFPFLVHLFNVHVFFDKLKEKYNFIGHEKDIKINFKWDLTLLLKGLTLADWKQE